MDGERVKLRCFSKSVFLKPDENQKKKKLYHSYLSMLTERIKHNIIINHLIRAVYLVIKLNGYIFLTIFFSRRLNRKEKYPSLS